MTAIALVAGSKYYAGADRPFFVSQGMVTSWLIGKGFSNVAWHKRAESMPAAVVPTKDPNYDDSWDEWVSADYTGPPGSVDPPVALPWLIVLLPTAAAATAQKPAPAPPTTPWALASAQASQAAAAAAKAALAAQAGTQGASGVGSGAVAPAPPPLVSVASALAPRGNDMASNAGAAVFVGGVLVILAGIAARLLGKRR